MRLDRVAREEGTVLLWAIGALLAGGMAMITASGVAELVAVKRGLVIATDQAALAAANEVLVAEFFATGDYSSLRVDLVAATAAAEAALTAAETSAELRKIESTATGVRLTAIRRWYPPLGLPSQVLTYTTEAALVLGD